MKKPSSSDKAGIYLTVIFHLLVIIVLLLWQIGAQLKKGDSFEITISEFEKFERLLEVKSRLEEEVAYKQAISQRIDAALAGSPAIRNIATSRNAPLKDDRGTDAEQLYKDAEKLQKDLSGGYDVDEPEDNYVPMNSPKQEKKAAPKPYSGPSVLSWNLEGRKASTLPIPAYRCMGGGEVTVIIGVDKSGKVVYAKVQEDTSSPDQCLRNFAIRAARMSRFSSSMSAPDRQMGDIVYQFIPQ